MLADCGGDRDNRAKPRSSSAAQSASSFPPAQAVRDGPLDTRVQRALSSLLPSVPAGKLDRDALAVVTATEHLVDIVANAHRFRRRWGCWPMEGWLREFAALGLVEWAPESDLLRLLQAPGITRRRST